MDGSTGPLVLLGVVVVLLVIAFTTFRRARRDADVGGPEIPIFLPPEAGKRPSPQAAPLNSRRPLEPEVFEGKTIRYHRPPPVTLQLLPGRLEVVSGEDQHEVIRFVRVPGQPPEISLGRSEGVPLRHIQFRAPTVSRQHALMAFAESRWVITNYSNTNPVVVNGVQLVPPVDQHVLSDGDEIELGEVVFRFRA